MEEERKRISGRFAVPEIEQLVAEVGQLKLEEDQSIISVQENPDIGKVSTPQGVTIPIVIDGNATSHSVETVSIPDAQGRYAWDYVYTPPLYEGRLEPVEGAEEQE